MCDFCEELRKIKAETKGEIFIAIEDGCFRIYEESSEDFYSFNIRTPVKNCPKCGETI